MPSLTHAQVIAMMEPVGTVWVQRHAHGMDVEITVHDERPDPAVYAWVVGGVVHYIGKAGHGLRRRMAEHTQGMKSSTRGAGHADHLAALTEARNAVMLYAMWPEPVEFRGQMIASHSSVEDWLLATINPLPVRNKEPRTR